MKLYQHFERVDRELELTGKSAEDSLTIADLSKLDMMNYNGASAVLECMNLLNLPSSQAKVLDIGSGLGGPARTMASNFDVKVTAIELQEDCSEKAGELTKRCSLQEKVNHLCLDFMTTDLNILGDGFSSYDLITSFLVFLHIDDKMGLFDRCSSMLKRKTGTLVIEDFYCKNNFSEKDIELLSRDVYCNGAALQSKESYCQSLVDAGFETPTFIDMTSDWRDFVENRRKSYEKDKERILTVHGTPTYESQLAFFKSVETLFNGGNLGGARVLCKRCAS